MTVFYPSVFDRFNLFPPKKYNVEPTGTSTDIYQPGEMFQTGVQFPPMFELERLSKYHRGRTIFDGKQYELYERASELLKDSPQHDQLKKLYLAVNLMDVLLVKPADLMVGSPPTYETGKQGSPEQEAVDEIVENNNLNQLIHELVVGAGTRGDAFIKTYYGYREDFSECPEIPPDVEPEPIIEAINPLYVFPELSRNSSKKFKAINVCITEWEFSRESGMVPYLNVERHIPGYIQYRRFRLNPIGIDNTFGGQIQIFSIGEQVPTEREKDEVPTGVPRILIQHVPYKTIDDDWRGISGIEKLESILAAINDRLLQIDYILWRHSDPTAYGPELEEGDKVRIAGRYIPVRKDEVIPGYMVWNSQLDGAFKELDILLGIVYQMSETPQWLFGTTLSQDKGGTGTSHTDGGAIKARFMPILTKVKRIRMHVDKAIKEAVYNGMELENYAKAPMPNFIPYEASRPTINWLDGLPRDDKEMAEVMQIRTGGKPTLDLRNAIKKLDEVDDEVANEIIAAIQVDEVNANGTVDASIFNEDNTPVEREGTVGDPDAAYDPVIDPYEMDGSTNGFVRTKQVGGGADD